jgi:ketosteroid isomerase-like protein
MDRTTRAIIQMECQQLLNRVTNLIDACQWEKLVEYYTEDGVLFRPSDPNNGVEGKAAILESFKARPPKTTCHALVNTDIDVQSETLVVASSRVWLVSGPASEGGAVNSEGPLLIGSFVDTLVYQNNRWLIKTRKGGIELKHA